MPARCGVSGRIAKSPAVVAQYADGCVRAVQRSLGMALEYDPETTIAAVRAPVVALMAADDETGSRSRALQRASAARVAAGREPIHPLSFGRDGHNLMRYRREAVTAAILEVADTA